MAKRTKTKPGTSKKPARRKTAAKMSKSTSRKAAKPAAKKAAKTPAVAKKSVKVPATKAAAAPRKTDDASWQVYADELQTKGDPRGEVMAIQRALVSKPDDAALRKAERDAIRPLLKGKLANYLERFRKMAEDLKKDASKVFMGWYPQPPATEREIWEVEQALGYTLDDSIKTFYRQTNGLQLFAMDRDAENFREDRHVPFSEPPEYSSSGDRLTESPGVTNTVYILKIRDAFLKDWEGQLYFDFMKDTESTKFGKKSYPQLTFAKSIKPFDLFMDFYQMVFVLAENAGNPPIVMSDDYGASLYEKVTDFETYLEHMLEDQARIGIAPDSESNKRGREERYRS